MGGGTLTKRLEYRTHLGCALSVLYSHLWLGLPPPMPRLPHLFLKQNTLPMPNTCTGCANFTIVVCFHNSTNNTLTEIQQMWHMPLEISNGDHGIMIEVLWGGSGGCWSKMVSNEWRHNWIQGCCYHCQKLTLTWNENHSTLPNLTGSRSGAIRVGQTSSDSCGRLRESAKGSGICGFTGQPHLVDSRFGFNC